MKSQSVNKYKKVENFLKNFQNLDCSKLWFVSGEKNLYKTIKIIELINLTKSIKGDIIEFGTWNGNMVF